MRVIHKDGENVKTNSQAEILGLLGKKIEIVQHPFIIEGVLKEVNTGFTIDAVKSGSFRVGDVWELYLDPIPRFYLK